MKGLLHLPVYEQGFLDDCEEVLPALVNGQANARLVLFFCTCMRRAGIASLLRTGRTAAFQRRVQRSGSAYLHFLVESRGKAVPVSAGTPFLDAVAVGDFDTANEIARYSNHEWLLTEEFEEDFLYYEFLMILSSRGKANGSGPSLLDRWEACLAGTDDPRLGVCRALTANNAADFDAALIGYLDARERDQRERLPLQEPEVAATEASVSIEGMALLRLALRQGFGSAAEHPQIPVRLADAPMQWPRDSFRTID